MGYAAPDPYQRPGSFRPQPDINVTPLVDVMLVLLIIFRVTAPLLAAGVKVELPRASSAEPLDPKAPIVVAIAKDGELTLDGETVDSADLAPRVKAKIGDDFTRVVHLRGDKDAAFGAVVSVMDSLAGQGIVHLAIVTEKAPPAPEPTK